MQAFNIYDLKDLFTYSAGDRDFTLERIKPTFGELAKARSNTAGALMIWTVKLWHLPANQTVPFQHERKPASLPQHLGFKIPKCLGTPLR